MSIFAKSADTNAEAPDRQRKENTSILSRSNVEQKGEISIVAGGVRIEGDLHVDGDVRVGGRINGKAHVSERLVVASGGAIIGGIFAGEGDIAGTVEGNVTIRGRLVIRASASVIGEIEAEAAMVEEGASISGSVKIGKPQRLSKQREQVGDGAPEGSPRLKLE